MVDRKSTRLNSSHTVIYTLSLHDALPISVGDGGVGPGPDPPAAQAAALAVPAGTFAGQQPSDGAGGLEIEFAEATPGGQPVQLGRDLGRGAAEAPAGVDDQDVVSVEVQHPGPPQRAGRGRGQA